MKNINEAVKTIKLTESQLKRLVEIETEPFNNGDIKEFGDSSEITTTVPTHDSEGVPQYGHEPISDEYADTAAVQNWWANSQNGGRVVP